MYELKGSTVTSIKEKERLYDFIMRARKEFEEKGEKNGYPFVVIGNHIFQLNELYNSLTFVFEGKRSFFSEPLSSKTPIDSFIEISSKHLDEVDKEYGFSDKKFEKDDRPIKVIEPMIMGDILEACLKTIEQAKRDLSSHYIFYSNKGAFDVDKLMSLSEEKIADYLKSYQDAYYDVNEECGKPLQDKLFEELIDTLSSSKKFIALLDSDKECNIANTVYYKVIDKYRENGGERVYCNFYGMYDEKVIIPEEIKNLLKKAIAERNEPYTVSQISSAINTSQEEMEKVIKETEEMVSKTNPNINKASMDDSNPGGDNR